MLIATCRIARARYLIFIEGSIRFIVDGSSAPAISSSSYMPSRSLGKRMSLYHHK